MRTTLITLAALVALSTGVALAQDSRAKQVRASGTVTVELFVGRQGVGVAAQRWSQAFERAGVAVTIRGKMYGDKPDVRETKSGASRHVTVVGEMDDRGRLIFPDRNFTENEAAKLFTWLKDLRTYGAQGNPDGEPAWGLSKTQFGTLHTALSEPLETDVRDEPLEDALKAFELHAVYPLVITPAAKETWLDRGEVTVQQRAKGVSKGTALAAVLNDAGLAFRPRRREDTRIELEIVPLKDTKNPWPIGWPLKQPILATVPTLFEMTQISLTDIDLDSVLDAASAKVKLPVLTDTDRLTAQKIDLSTAKVRHPPKRTAWMTALKDLAFQAKARVEIWIDESGNPFLWITPNNAPRRPNSDAPIAPPGKTAVRP